MAQTDININVKPEDLITEAGNIKGIATDMRGHLDKILHTIDTLAGGTWESPASKATEDKIIAFSSRFPQFEDKMNEFAMRLETIAGIHRDTDSTIERTAASTFQE